MPNINDSLKNASLPRFFLFKNLVIGKSGPNPFPGEALRSFEWFKFSDDLNELVVPKPPIPAEFRARDFGTLGMLDAIRLEELVEERVRFDTTLEEFCDWKREVPSDLDLFGVRYTILFLVPHDPQKTVEYLIKLIQGQAEKRKDKKVDSEILRHLWGDYIDRMWPYPETEGMENISAVSDLLEKRLNELPSGPTRLDWEDLNESLTK